MSKVLQVLKKNITTSDSLEYNVRAIDERFHAVEIVTSENIPFKMFYYIVDMVDGKVFYGDYTVPDGVTTRRILNGIEASTKP